VIDRLHPWRVVRELRVPEVRLGRARRDDQTVVRDLIALPKCFDSDAAGLQIDTGYFAKNNARIPLVTEKVADWGRNVALGQNPGRELTQQRLNQVVVSPINDGDSDVGTPQPLGRSEPTESATDDHDLMPAAGC
jgi:hypothetical protein